MRKFIFAVLFVMLYAGMPGMSIHAQTPKKAHRTLKNGNVRLTAGQPGGYPFAISGAFSSSTGNTINKGLQTTVEYAVGGRWSLRADSFGLSQPSGTMINMGGGQWKLPLSAIFGPKAPATFKNVYLGVHAGLGAVKASGGAESFGVGGGASLDYQVTSNVFVRMLDATDVYSRGLSPQNQVLGNYNNLQFGSGIGFSF